MFLFPQFHAIYIYKAGNILDHIQHNEGILVEELFFGEAWSWLLWFLS